MPNGSTGPPAREAERRPRVERVVEHGVEHVVNRRVVARHDAARLRGYVNAHAGLEERRMERHVANASVGVARAVRSFAVREQCRALFCGKPSLGTEVAAALRIRRTSPSHSDRRGAEEGLLILGPGQAVGAREGTRGEEHESKSLKAASRPVGCLRFLAPEDAAGRLEPTANGSRRETSINHRHFVDAHRYRMCLRAQGGFRRGSKTARLIDSSLVVCQRVQLLASRRAKQHCTRPTFRIADSSF